MDVHFFLKSGRLQVMILLIVNDVTEERVHKSIDLATGLKQRGVLILPIGVSTDYQLEKLRPVIKEYASEPKVICFKNSAK